jgi:hypothetical protein
MKTKKQNIMKTRILTLTGMVLLTTASMTNAAHHKGIHTSAASSHENEIRMENSALTSSGSTAMTISLEEWITVRENWEQESATAATAATAMTLEEWVVSRDNWEQDGQGLTAAPTADKSVSLEEWIAGCESWEQESSFDTATISHSEMSGMEEWMAELANWEQK